MTVAVTTKHEKRIGADPFCPNNLRTFSREPVTWRLLQDCPSSGRNQFWLLSHANGTWLRGLLGSERRWENSNFREVEMTNIMTEAVSTPGRDIEEQVAARGRTRRRES